MHSPLAPLLREHGVVLLDGALATELERRGCDLHDPLWSAKVLIENPALIAQVHYDYFAAGADVAISASYQASFAGFAARGIGHAQAVALMQRSVELALSARERFWAEPANHVGRAFPLVAASVGPYGATLHDGSEYRGDYGLSLDELIAFHRPRFRVLAEAGADLLACETIPCLVEAEALLTLLSEHPAARAWVSFTARDGAHTCHGEPIAAAGALVGSHPQVLAVGVNCTAPEHIPALVATIAGATDAPVLVYPNSGERYDAASGGWCGEADLAGFAAQARGWYQAGARLIGGCCRTTPAHIAALAAKLRG